MKSFAYDHTHGPGDGPWGVSCPCGNEAELTEYPPTAHARRLGWREDAEGRWHCPEYPACRAEWDEDDE